MAPAPAASPVTSFPLHPDSSPFSWAASCSEPAGLPAGDLSRQIRQLSPASLAYLGDAVYELYVRTHFLWPPKRLGDYHRRVVAQVRAESQAVFLRQLDPYLTDQERDIVRWGRNAASGRPRRLPADLYRQATSLETLIGYLYLQDPQRLNQLLGELDRVLL